MEHNAAKPSGWFKCSGWFAVAAAMALSALPALGDTMQAPPVTLVANPLPAGQDQTTLTWNAPDSSAVEIHVGSPTRTPFADGGPTGSAVTGPWAGLGMSFYLVDATTHQPLASAVIQQPGATLTASPNPLPDGVNQTTLTWNAPNSVAIEIHVGSPTGILFAEDGPSGSLATGPWASTGMSFYLVDAATHQQIAWTTIQDPSAPTMNFLANCPAGSDPNLCTNHPVVQTSDANCATCHQAKETTEFDLSVPGAHTIPTNSTQLHGVTFALQSVVGWPALL